MEMRFDMGGDSGRFSTYKNTNKNGGHYPLTGIRHAYTLASPQEQGAGEVDRLIISNFLNTLAEIALSVATRKVNG
jgi:hypothetical protein